MAKSDAFLLALELRMAQLSEGQGADDNKALIDAYQVVRDDLVSLTGEGSGDHELHLPDSVSGASLPFVQSQEIDVPIVLVDGVEDRALPVRKSQDAAGVDLKSTIDIDLEPMKVAVVPTGIRMAVPRGFEGQIRTRSGHAVKGIFVVNSPGTIDADYRGEVKIILCNLGPSIFNVAKYDRIAQLIITRVPPTRLALVESLDETERGEGGFGSTGVK